VGDEPGHLLLLEFLLKRLWEDRRGAVLHHDAYQAMGGLHGAVATKAEEVFDKLSPLEQQAAHRLFLQIVRPSSETYGILGRVYKDRWEAAVDQGNSFLARGLLKKAVEAYLRGFEADWRDAYPGVNAVTLMEISEPPDPRRERLIPVVAYAVERRIASGKPDYWDYATRLELAVLAKDEQGAMAALGDALALVRETWEPETTIRNLRLIREARESRGGPVPWAKAIEDSLVPGPWSTA
jgi:hypothetical protein